MNKVDNLELLVLCRCFQGYAGRLETAVQTQNARVRSGVTVKTPGIVHPCPPAARHRYISVPVTGILRGLLDARHRRRKMRRTEWGRRWKSDGRRSSKGIDGSRLRRSLRLLLVMHLYAGRCTSHLPEGPGTSGPEPLADHDGRPFGRFSLQAQSDLLSTGQSAAFRKQSFTSRNVDLPFRYQAWTDCKLTLVRPSREKLPRILFSGVNFSRRNRK